MGGCLKTFGIIYVLVSLLACGLSVLLRLDLITYTSLTSIAIGVLLIIGGRIAEYSSASGFSPVQSAASGPHYSSPAEFASPTAPVPPNSSAVQPGYYETGTPGTPTT
jgi:hypothetical protein